MRPSEALNNALIDIEIISKVNLDNSQRVQIAEVILEFVSEVSEAEVLFLLRRVQQQKVS